MQEISNIQCKLIKDIIKAETPVTKRYTSTQRVAVLLKYLHTLFNIMIISNLRLCLSAGEASATTQITATMANLNMLVS